MSLFPLADRKQGAADRLSAAAALGDIPFTAFSRHPPRYVNDSDKRQILQFPLKEIKKETEKNRNNEQLWWSGCYVGGSGSKLTLLDQKILRKVQVRATERDVQGSQVETLGPVSCFTETLLSIDF